MMTRPQPVPANYRGRNEMTLVEFIEDVEKCHFRTPFDTGANHNAMFIWNIVRGLAGLEQLTEDDLIQNYADTDGSSFEEMKSKCDEHAEWYKEYWEKQELARLKRKYES